MKSINGFGHVEDAEYPDTSGFQCCGEQGWNLAAKGKQRKEPLSGREVGSRKLLKR